jgi:iron complex outermembrane receptor protein
MKKLVVILLIFCTASFRAQTSVKGRVQSDSLGIFLSGVEISMPEHGITVKSDSAGNFRIKNVPRGRELLVFSHYGFRSFMKEYLIKDSLDLGMVSLEPSMTKITEVVVFGQNYSEPEKTSNNIQPITADEMRMNGAMNLSDGIAKLPGISQLSTGAGITKPVIRGLFGNRIQTVLYGVRFDNQQWQDEHGLGLSDVGIDRVEIIKGPASLLYGSEAMGGVINIIEEKSAPVGTVRADVSTRFFSNTYGVTTDAGVKGATEKFNWRVRAGMDSHADYSDGNDQRVLNSRFGGYYAKAGIGFNRKKWINKTNYMFTQSNFGFLMDPIQLKDPPDDRMSRGFDRPHHTVNLNIFSSQNIFLLKASELTLNLSYQSNNRQEQEGGSKVSLDMLLSSYIGNCVWKKTLSKKIDLSIGSQGYYQSNLNQGSRTIIPDANSMEVSGYSYLKANLKKLVIEGGARYDRRSVETFSTGLINTDPYSNPGRTVLPFQRSYSSVNGSGGMSWFPATIFNVKMNLSSGYRGGNLAELSSNGLHEGTIRYEIGNTNLKIEQNLCADLGIYLQADRITFTLSAYNNQFFNYIYLAPDTTEYLGFKIYNYVQNDAAIRGIEGGMSVQPLRSDRIKIAACYSYIDGTIHGGSPLPFIPAPKLNADLQLVLVRSKVLKDFTFKPGIVYVFRQDRPAELETSTGDYYLVNASLSSHFKFKKNEILLSVSGNNLMNLAYYDHLSRFKYYGIYNVGRNIGISFKFIFN